MLRLFTFLSISLICFTLEAQNFVSSSKFKDGSSFGSSFGSSIAISGDYAVVADIGNTYDENGQNYMSAAGAVFIYKLSASGDWEQIQKLTSPQREQWAEFGSAVAIEGDYLVVGSPGESRNDDPDLGSKTSGKVYVFEKGQDGIWVLGDTIVKEGDGYHYDAFGSSLALSNGVIVIGAHYQDYLITGNLYYTNVGGVHIYEKDNDKWILQQQLKASDWKETDSFGYKVAIDNDYLLVSAIGVDGEPGFIGDGRDAGAVYVYEKVNDKWVFRKKILADQSSEGDYFGYSLDIEGNYGVVGVYGDSEDEDNLNPVNDAGSVYVVYLNGENSQILKKIVSPFRGEYNRFGRTVAIDNDVLLIGESYQKFNTKGEEELEGEGLIHVYERLGNWSYVNSVQHMIGMKG